MKFRLPPQELKTKAKIKIYNDKLNDKGQKVLLKEMDAIGCFYSEGDTIRNANGELTKSNSSFYINGDACPELFEIHYADVIIENTTLSSLKVKKARFKGNVVYTKFLLE